MTETLTMLTVIALVFQVLFMYLLYTGTHIVYRVIMGVICMVIWFTTAYTIIVVDPTYGIPLAYLYRLFGTLSVIFSLAGMLDLMEEKSWW